MPKKPILNGLQLKECCVKTMREIEDSSKAGLLLRAILPVSPFITMFGSNPANALFTVSTTDWDGLVKATGSVPVVVKRTCHRLAFTEFGNHPGGDLNRFWDAMCEVFK